MISQIGFLTERTVTAVVLSIVCFAVFLIVSAYLLRESKNPGWYDRFGNKLAIAVSVFMFGETLSRGWGAILIVMYYRGMDIGVIENRFPLAFTGSVLMLIGMICKLRILTPEILFGVRTGEWFWMAIATFAIGVGVIVLII